MFELYDVARRTLLGARLHHNGTCQSPILLSSHVRGGRERERFPDQFHFAAVPSSGKQLTREMLLGMYYRRFEIAIEKTLVS